MDEKSSLSAYGLALAVLNSSMDYNVFLTIRLGWLKISPKITVFLSSHKFLAPNAFLTTRVAIELDGGK